jgi:hypothetical protein
MHPVEGLSGAAIVIRGGRVSLGLTSTTSGDVPPDAASARGYRNGQPVVPWPLSAMPGCRAVVSELAGSGGPGATSHDAAVAAERPW